MLRWVCSEPSRIFVVVRWLPRQTRCTHVRNVHKLQSMNVKMCDCNWINLRLTTTNGADEDEAVEKVRPYRIERVSDLGQIETLIKPHTGPTTSHGRRIESGMTFGKTKIINNKFNLLFRWFLYKLSLQHHQVHGINRCRWCRSRSAPFDSIVWHFGRSKRNQFVNWSISIGSSIRASSSPLIFLSIHWRFVSPFFVAQSQRTAIDTDTFQTQIIIVRRYPDASTQSRETNNNNKKDHSNYFECLAHSTSSPFLVSFVLFVILRDCEHVRPPHTRRYPATAEISING